MSQTEKRTPAPSLRLLQSSVDESRNRLLDVNNRVEAECQTNDRNSTKSLIARIKDLSLNFESTTTQLFKYHMQNGNVSEAAQVKSEKMKLVYGDSRDSVEMLNLHLGNIGADAESEMGSYVSQATPMRSDFQTEPAGPMQDDSHSKPREETSATLENEVSNGKSTSLASGHSERLDLYTRHQLKCDLLRGSTNLFRGEPEKFYTWKNEIQHRMMEAEVNAYDALQIVRVHCADRPLKIVSSFIDAGGEDAEQILVNIFETLRKRFGTTHQIANSLLEKIKDFPVIKGTNNIVKLQELHDLCLIVSTQMTNCDELKIMDLEHGMRMIWGKLPENIQSKWRRRSYTHFTQVGKKPDFLIFIEFLDNVTQELTHIDIHNESSHSSKNFTNRGHRTLVTHKGTSDNYCSYHDNSSHQLSDCRTFSKKPFHERKKFAQDKRLCFVCLGTHRRSDCKFEGKCPLCDGKHCRGMHRDDKPKQSGGTHSNSDSNEEVRSACTVCKYPNSSVCSKTLRVKIRFDSEQTMDALCIIDEQSNASFCDSKVAHFFGITPMTETYKLTTLSGYCSRMSGGSVNGLSIKGIGERNWISLPTLYTHNNLPDTRDEMAVKKTVQLHSHVSQFADKFPRCRPECEVLLLIGSNCGAAMKTKCFGDTYPFVHHTPLGWALVGPVCLDKERNQIKDVKRVLRVSLAHDHPKLTNLIEPRKDPFNYGRTAGTFDISHDDEELGHSQDDRKFTQIITDGIKINDDGNIEMPLPVKSEDAIPNNKIAVYHRTKNTLNRLLRDPDKLDGCLRIFGEYLQNGHVEEVPDNEKDASRACWLPIFPVYHPVKKKPRLVFDSSATFNGQSLNKALYQGPDENNKLIGVLLRFRHGEVGISADIQKMFHSFYVDPHDRNLLRFYWYRDNNPKKGICQFRAKVHIFGNRPSPSIATFGLRYAVEQHKEIHEDCYNFVCKNFYVDDALGSADTVEEAVKLLGECRSILSNYNILLHKISSNSSQVLDSFPSTDLADENKVHEISDDQLTRTLGVVWHVKTDEFSLHPRVPQRPFTKRGILSVINSVYDPFGLATPVVLTGKLIQRKVLSSSTTGDSEVTVCDWDSQLPAKYQSEWQEWSKSLVRTSEIKISRCYKPKAFGNIVRRELHCFSDASKDAIGYVLYLKHWNERQESCVSFLFANSRVSPRSADTIPRLELGAAMEATQVTRSVVLELGVNIDNFTFYTDSMVVIGYLSNTEKRFSRYVCRRIEEILSFTSVEQWKYISTKENVADIATRPHTVEQLLKSTWLRGPQFLHDGGEHVEAVLPEMIDLPEVKCVSTKTDIYKNDYFKSLYTYTGSWKKALRIVSYVVKFINIFFKLKCTPKFDGPMVADCQLGASRFLIRSAQREIFGKEVECLQRKKALPSSSSLLSLSPFLCEAGMLRVGGRLKNANFPGDVKHPVLLPSSHPLTHMIALEHHKSVQHQGRHLTHGAIRQEGFHILHGSKVVKNLINNCFICKRLRGKFLNQKMSNLPPDRLEETPPFSNVGIDLFGPFNVHDGKATRRSAATRKCWGLLITCLVSRAIHVDLVPSLDTSSVRLALRRFYALRGTCKKIRSDRGTNFMGAKNQLLDVEELQQDASNHNVMWEMNPPNAPSWGGVWERKVGALKKILDGILIQRRNLVLSRDELATFLQEAASIVNNTPLWNVSSSPDDPAPISPAMIMTLRESPNPPPIEKFSATDLNSYGKSRWKRVMFLSEEFWKRWRSHYVHQLQHRHKWKITKPCLAVGDVVMVKQDCKRNIWPVGRVKCVRFSRDGLVRAVTVQLGGQAAREITRPLTDLVLLAASSEHDCD